MMGWYGDMGAHVWVFMGLFWIVLIASIIWLVVRLLPSKARSGVGVSQAPPLKVPIVESPFEILDRGLARGEIDLETYQARRSAMIAARGEPR